ATAITPAAFGMSGQSCISVQRIYVHQQVADSLLSKLKAKAEALRMGPPDDSQSEIVPMVTEAAAMRVEKAVQAAVAAGARLVCGGTRDGAYLAPTIL